MNLEALFTPTSVAVVGASERPTIGRRLIASLDRIGFSGVILPVNPNYSSVSGRRCYASLAELPEIPDVAAFCVGHERILDPFLAAAQLGVKAAVIYDGGFAERGEEGRRLQSRIAGICREAGIALCGPNCMGVLNPHHRSTTYLQELRDPAGLAGNVGIVSQSGGFCIGLLSDVRRFGFSHVVSSGNEAVLAAADYLEYLVDDPRTQVIGGFIETVRHPDRFVAALDRAAAQGKPVVMLKVGRTGRTQHAVTTHTGGIAGDPGSASELFRAHDAIEVSGLVEFAEVIAAAQSTKRAVGRRIGIVTSSGGLAELIPGYCRCGRPAFAALVARGQGGNRTKGRFRHRRRQPARRLGERQFCRQLAAGPWLVRRQPGSRHRCVLPRQLRRPAVRNTRARVGLSRII
jgi:acyl-CoA synthetase (NDP forming)